MESLKELILKSYDVVALDSSHNMLLRLSLSYPKTSFQRLISLNLNFRS